MAQYYISQDYAVSVQQYCAMLDPANASSHRHIDESAASNTQHPLEVIDHCAKSICASKAGIWGYCLERNASRSELIPHVVLNATELKNGMMAIRDYNQVITNAISYTVEVQPNGSIESGILLLPTPSETTRFLLESVQGVGLLLLVELVQRLGLAKWDDEVLGDQDLLNAALKRLGLVRVLESSSAHRKWCFSSQIVSSHFPESDHRLHKVLVRELDRHAKDIVSWDSLSDRVQHYVADKLEYGVSLDAVCEHFHVSRRTLSRQMQQSGTSFVTIRDGVRRERALQLICEKGVPLKRIAQRCGYNSLSAFTQAFSGWTGQSPSAYRNSLDVRAIPDR